MLVSSLTKDDIMSKVLQADKVRKFLERANIKCPGNDRKIQSMVRKILSKLNKTDRYVAELRFGFESGCIYKRSVVAHLRQTKSRQIQIIEWAIFARARAIYEEEIQKRAA